MSGLEEILNGSDEEEVIEAPVETPEPATGRDEKGRFAPKGVEEEGAPPAPVNQLPPDEYKALKEERQKRQALEARLAELEAAKPHEEPAPPPSLWEDENAWGGHLVSTAVQHATLNARLDMSEMMMRQSAPDFDDMKAEFLALADQNPSLFAQARSDPHPWNKAYQIAKNHKTMQDLGAVDVQSLETKLREKIMAEIQQQKPAQPELPQSLADATSQRGGSAAPPSKLSLEDILKGA